MEGEDYMKKMFRSNCFFEALRHAGLGKGKIFLVFPWDYPRGVHFFWKVGNRYFDFCGKSKGNLLARAFFHFHGHIRELPPSHDFVQKGFRLF